MEIKTTIQIIKENVSKREEEYFDKPITVFHNVDVKWVRVDDVEEMFIKLQSIIDKSNKNMFGVKQSDLNEFVEILNKFYKELKQ